MTRLSQMGFALAALASASVTLAADTTTKALWQVMQESFASANDEDLPRHLATMSVEMPNRQLFIDQCKSEWAASDIYYRLDDLKILRQSEWRPPYLVARITQTITAVDAAEGAAGKAPVDADDRLSHLMSLRTDEPTTEYELLFKRERGKWKIVAALTEPRPVGTAPKEASLRENCSGGGCQWPSVSR